jgi:aminodeoxyfutalosine synthase
MSAPSKGGASRDGYGSALLKLADDPRVVVLEADLGKSTKSCLFRAEYPERTVSMGIAEQNMMLVSAGMASSGKIPFASTFAIFTERAFRKGPRHNDAYALSVDEYLHRIKPFSEVIDEVHSVGGLHPDWTIEYYEELYRAAKKTFPHIHIKSLTAVEVKHISSRSGLNVEETLSRLKLAGLDSLPGGGAEILVDSVRDRICRGKESSDEYLSIHEIAHGLGIKTNCTMLFGTVETVRERAIHLYKLRTQQDVSNGFQCFVPYPFLPDKSRLPEAQLASMNEIIRVIAISRIMLDNIPHIKAYRMNIGSHVASIALNSGADDIDGTVNHEEIMHEAGSSARLDSDSEVLARIIENVDSIPIKRNTTYSNFTRYNRKPDDDSRRLPVAQSTS